MNMGNYAHGNQPIQHMLYLYDWCRQPWKAQARIREVMDKFYTSAPDGYCGDEDNGQTSAWYIFSALGFYPVCPASDQYVMGAPLFKKATLHLASGDDFVIEAPENSAENRYMDNVRLNGKEYSRNYITHSDITSGGKMTVSMSAEPNTQRGTTDEDRPYSFSRE
jgi:predicted alpha-1,2-mannosidase